MDRSANDRLQPETHPAVPACDDQAAPDPAALADPTLLTPVQRRVARLVQTLETDIIPRLVKAHRPAAETPGAAVPVSWPALEALARMCYAANEGPLHGAVLALRQAGVPVERIYVELLAPAARELGRLWEEDHCDFTDVTVGVGRLQQLLRELSPAFGAELERPADGRRILLLPAPGEQHTLGASMAAEFFRRAGWDVVGGVGGLGLDPVEAVQAEWFDILGLSAGNLARVDWLRDCIAHARRVSRNHGLGVLVGGPLFVTQPDVGATLGCDFVVTEGQRGPEFAEALLASRSQRL
ncbi:MAG: cobalamin-dependent protein [Rubrivivax sp.]|nr:cobalamin-dependent protein [Rubrivivax sp.]